MALIRRDYGNREVARGNAQEYHWDPFRAIDTLLRWDPFRYDTGNTGNTGNMGNMGLMARANNPEFSPRFDVKEVKDAYVIKADLPGVKQDGVEVSVNGSLLTVSGKREDEHRAEGEQYFTVERSYGSFSRSFSLPDTADAQNVSADLKDGVLVIQVPKRAEAQPKKITIGQGPEAAKAKA